MTLTKTQLSKSLNWITALCAVIFLGVWMVRLNDSLWSDEAFTGVLLRQSPREIVSVMSHENNPPLYYLLLYPFRLLLGSGEFALRLPSLLFALATFALLRFELRYDRRLRELASILFLISTGLYYISTEARYYALVTFLYFLTFMCVRRLREGAWDEHSWKLKLVYVLSSTLLLYSHSLAVIMVAVHMAYLLWPDLVQLKTKFNKEALAGILKQQIYLVLPVLAYIPWAFVVVRQIAIQKEIEFWLVFDPIHSLVHVPVLLWNPGVSQGKVYDILLDDYPLLSALIIIGAVITFGFVLLAIYRVVRSKQNVYALPLAVMPVTYLASFIFPLFFFRYFSFVFPFVAIIVAASVLQLFRDSSRWAKPALAMMLIAFVAGLVIYYSYPQKMPVKKAVVDIAVNEQTMVATYNEYQYLGCIYYFPDCQLLYRLDEIDENIGYSLFPYLKSTTIIPEEIETIYVLYNDKDGVFTDSKLSDFEQTSCRKYGTESQFAEHLNVCIYQRQGI